jgi:hypothetical protein
MTQQQSVYSETEKKAAERYLWWPIYLVREKRRLAGITEAVRAGAAVVEHTSLAPDVSLDDTQPAPADFEEIDELLGRIDVALSANDVLPWLEKMEDREEEESKAQGISLRDEKTIPDDVQKGKNSGRAALLGRKKHGSEAEDF